MLQTGKKGRLPSNNVEQVGPDDPRRKDSGGGIRKKVGEKNIYVYIYMCVYKQVLRLEFAGFRLHSQVS